ncbi:MAG TPA: hypothetical protein VFV37_02215 [Luteibaculaceae bacterium]|nr:hypothetical protein [Luteibaculaceae bacterium]
MRLGMLFLGVWLACAACTKTKVERTPPRTSGTTSVDKAVADTLVSQAGLEIDTLISLDQVLTIDSNSFFDSVGVVLRLSGTPSFGISMIRDTLRADNGIYFRNRAVFSDLRGTCRIAFPCNSMYYGNLLGAELSAASLCSPQYESIDSLETSYQGPNQIDFYAFARHTTGFDIEDNRFRLPLQDPGYLAFRFLDDGQIRYGWVSVQVVSANQIKVLQVSF